MIMEQLKNIFAMKLGEQHLMGACFVSVWMGIFALAVPSNAQTVSQYFTADDNACFARHYTKKHLDKHPKQRVKSISISYFPNAYKIEDNVRANGTIKQVVVNIQLRLRGSKKVFEEVGSCEKKNGHFYCGIECDGGGFDLVNRTGGKILLKTAEYGFRVVAGGGCDGSVGEEFYKRITRKTDDKAFLLSRLPAAQCVEPPKED